MQLGRLAQFEPSHCVPDVRNSFAPLFVQIRGQSLAQLNSLRRYLRASTQLIIRINPADKTQEPRYDFAMPLADGQALAGYRILRILGFGGMGEAYLVQNPRLQVTNVQPATDLPSKPRYSR